MKFVLILCLIGLLCCRTKSESEYAADTLSTTPFSSGIDTAAAVQSAPVRPKTFSEINAILFNNLVNGEFGPYAVEDDSGYYYLDIESYKERLRTHGIFSEAFFSHEEERVKACKEDLEKLRYKGDTDTGWAPQSCFFDFMYWLRSQEKPQAFEIKDLTANDTTAFATMVFFDEYDGKKSYWDNFVYLNIHYKKESNNEWKVTGIVRLPD